MDILVHCIELLNSYCRDHVSRIMFSGHSVSFADRVSHVFFLLYESLLSYMKFHFTGLDKLVIKKKN